jgi:hypothetical protein
MEKKEREEIGNKIEKIIHRIQEADDLQSLSEKLYCQYTNYLTTACLAVLEWCQIYMRGDITELKCRIAMWLYDHKNEK